MSRTKNVKNITKNLVISKFDVIRTRSFQFALQKWVMFLAIFAASFFILWDFDLFETNVISKLHSDYPSLIYKFFLLLTVYMVAHPLVRNTAESYNRSIHSWLSTLLLVVYIVCLIVLSDKTKITDVNSIEFKHLIWLIPGVVLPMLVKILGVILTLRLSPIQSKKMIFTSLVYTSIALEAGAGMGLMNYVILKGNTFDLNDWVVSLLISIIAIALLFGCFFYVYSWWKFRKINFTNLTVSIPLIVILPIFLAVLIWMIKGTFNDVNLNLTPELWFIVGCGMLLILIFVFTFFFAKEIRAAKVMNTLFSTALVAIWIGVFVYVNYYGIVDKSYIIVDMASATSFVIFVMMALYDRTTKSSLIQESLFSWMIVIMMVLIVFFTVVGKAKLFNVIVNYFPVDLKALLPVLLIALPGIYFIVSVTKVMWAQSRITHGIRIERAIKKRMVREMLEEQSYKGVKNE